MLNLRPDCIITLIIFSGKGIHGEIIFEGSKQALDGLKRVSDQRVEP
jgi:hypothetical protein